MKSVRLNLAALLVCLFLFGCNDEGGPTAPKASVPDSKPAHPTELSPSEPPPSSSVSTETEPSPEPEASPEPDPSPDPDPSPSPSSAPYSYSPTKSEIFAGALGEFGYEDGNDLSLVRFSAPTSVAVAPDGKVYITDRNLHTIRLYDPATLSVSTPFGKSGTSGTTNGNGTAARFKGPTAAVVLGGFLYVCDSDNHQIRKIDLSTSDVTTLAGSASGYTDGAFSSAQFKTPRGIATDGTHLYVSEYGGHTIRKLDLSTSTVSTIAGLSGTAGNTNGIGAAARFRNPIGIAASATHLYVSDYSNHRIRAIELATQNVTTLAGSSAGYVNATGTAARFRNPYDLCLSGTSLYISDYSNSLLRKVDTATGITSLAAGQVQTKQAVDGVTPNSRLGNPTAVACVTGAVLVTDLYLKNIRDFNTATSTLTTRLGPLIAPIACSLEDGALSSNRLITPSGGARIDDFYYFADSTNHVIRKLNLNSGNISLVAGKVATAGAVDGTLENARLRTPLGMATDGIHLYFADSKNFTVRKIDLTAGTVSVLAGTSGVAGTADGSALTASFKDPSNLLYSDNVLYVADSGNHAIRAINLSTLQVTTVAGVKGSAGNANGALGAAKFNQPKGMVLIDGQLYIADYGNQTVRKVSLDTGVTSLVAGKAGTAGFIDGSLTAARFNRPISIAQVANDLFIADQYNNAVRKISLLNGSVSTLNLGTAASSIGPSRESSGTITNVKYHLPQSIHYDPTLGLMLSNRCSIQLLTE